MTTQILANILMQVIPLERRSIVRGCLLAVLAITTREPRAAAQSYTEEPQQTLAAVPSLQLTPAQASALEQALKTRDYIRAEKLLIPEAQRDPNSPHTVLLLNFLGSIYFLNHDYLNAAIAWKKSAALAPLTLQLQFSLAMAYIRLGHADWSRDVLSTLATENPKEALYPYWLGRLAYDAHLYQDAIQHFKNAIALDPHMARAYDNLGLCYYYQNQNELAVENYRKAIELDLHSPHPSPWPYLNLAATLDFLNQPGPAESNLREAIHLDPNIAPAHFQLGNILEKTGHPEQAISEFQQAARLDPNYAEPHFALARSYNKLGRKSEAQAEVQTYQRIHQKNQPAH